MGVAERPCKHRNTLRLMLALCSGSNSEFPCSGQQGLASVMQSLPLLRSSEGEGHVLCTVHPHKMLRAFTFTHVWHTELLSR